MLLHSPGQERSFGRRLACLCVSAVTAGREGITGRTFCRFFFLLLFLFIIIFDRAVYFVCKGMRAHLRGREEQDSGIDPDARVIERAKIVWKGRAKKITLPT